MKLKIDKLGMNGEGVARPLRDNVNAYKTNRNENINKDLQKVTFVDFALPNEIIEAEVVQEKSKFCNAKLVEVVESSADRVVAPCPYFSHCGGCNLQHLKYDKQLEFKTNLVKETLFKVGGLDLEVLPCVSSNDYGYRNKGVFPLGRNIGMFELGSHNIVSIDKCMLMNDKINLTLNIVREWISENNIKTFDFNTYKGLLKYLVVRSVNNQTLVCLVATSSDIKHLDKLTDKLSVLGKFGLYININNQHNSIILGRKYIHIAGIKSIKLNEFGVGYDIDVASFLQVNNEIKTKLYSEVIASVGGGIVIDAYAGAGLLSAILSKSASKVYSVEIITQASEKARQLVKTNNITNMEVINGDCTKVVPNLIKKVQNEIKSNHTNLKCSVVLDPAHIGCSPEVIQATKCADKIIYIACNPIALAKDLKVFQQTHNIISIQPFDMFPNTKHVETLAILERRK
ncbi:MAG: 23S rRNA (uracil(1939)-C(5))-methyltransferase RlmD [Clostridia bacterium]|nr:23S rRNA (uracil(1939)-C(5))-methyltransferase RlmD [Clostridia bacterium]